MFTSKSVVNALRLLWVLTIIWYEVGIFINTARRCHWPDERAPSSPTTNNSRILLVADPQILDHRSYDDRGPFLMFLTQKIVDLNLRKNWHAALQKQPDRIIFLGDMMDGGRWNIDDDEYRDYYQRFQRIFKPPHSTPMHFLPGNHDVPLQDSELFSPMAESRYTSHFGPLNSEFTAAGYRIILLDAPGLVKEDAVRKRNSLSFENWNPDSRGPAQFLQTAGKSHQPTILLTHIPLARNGFECGPLREKGYIRPGIGFGYQNTLGREATDFALSTLRPEVVFSGDDHDYCEHFHRAEQTAGHTVREVSVKSFSMAMGIKRPGFQLLSLTSPNGDGKPRYADLPCFLPDQISIYLAVYIPLLSFSLLLLFLSNVFLPPRTRSSTRDQRHGGLLGRFLKGQDSNRYTLPLHNVEQQQLWWSKTMFWLGRLCRADKERGYDRGLSRRLVRDIVDVAVYPCIVFPIICWWYTL